MHPQHQKQQLSKWLLWGDLKRMLQRGSKGSVQADSSTAPRQCSPRCPRVTEFVCETLKACLYHSNPYKKATEAGETVQLVKVSGPNLPTASHRMKIQPCFKTLCPIPFFEVFCCKAARGVNFLELPSSGAAERLGRRYAVYVLLSRALTYSVQALGPNPNMHSNTDGVITGHESPWRTARFCSSGAKWALVDKSVWAPKSMPSTSSWVVVSMKSCSVVFNTPLSS